MNRSAGVPGAITGLAKPLPIRGRPTAARAAQISVYRGRPAGR